MWKVIKLNWSLVFGFRFNDWLDWSNMSTLVSGDQLKHIATELSTFTKVFLVVFTQVSWLHFLVAFCLLVCWFFRLKNEVIQNISWENYWKPFFISLGIHFPRWCEWPCFIKKKLHRASHNNRTKYCLGNLDQNSEVFLDRLSFIDFFFKFPSVTSPPPFNVSFLQKSYNSDFR